MALTRHRYTQELKCGRCRPINWFKIPISRSKHHYFFLQRYITLSHEVAAAMEDYTGIHVDPFAKEV